MNVGSSFSGIGGLDLGLERAGFRHVFFCESDPYRRAVLAARFPGVPVYDDVRAVGADARGGHGRGDAGVRPGGDLAAAEVPGHIDLLCGGFPCQDLSVAGQRRGLAGDRSSLFFEFARVADALRPRWLLVENVPGLLSSNGGRDFGAVVGTLADIGYGLGWRILDSRYFGVPQRRRRVFIVGARADGDPRAAAERAGQILAVGTRCPRHPAQGTKTGPDVAVASLSGLGTGDPVNHGKAGGCTVDVEQTHVVSYALNAKAGYRDDGESETFVAAPLTKGSATGHGVNPPGRRQEDDVNLVVAGPLGGGNDGAGRRSEDDPNLVAYPISGDALRGEGTALTPSPDAEGRVRLRDPGFAVGDDGDPAFTISAASPGAVATASVRRLTPTECERLQALPDGWTQLGATPDSRRYAALGDAVTASVAEWIGRRLLEASA